MARFCHFIKITHVAAFNPPATFSCYFWFCEVLWYFGVVALSRCITNLWRMEWRTLSSAIAINADKALSFNDTSRHYDTVQFVLINVCLIFSHLQMPHSLNDSYMFIFLNWIH